MNLYTPQQVVQARRRVTEEPGAKDIMEGIVSSAAPWLDREDAAIADLIPDAAVPRSFSINYVTGCPVHGSGPEGYSGYAMGGWKYDPFKDRWRVTCAVGGESYPSNDFEAFYQSGMKDRSLLAGPFADDGWGWRAEGSAYKHWFVAYCCQQLWHH